MTKYFTATTTDAVTFTRSSVNRTYSHAVVTIGSVVEGLKQNRKSAAAHWEMNLPHHMAYIDGTSPSLLSPGYLTNPGQFSPHMSDERRAELIVEYQAEMAERVIRSKALVAAGKYAYVEAAVTRFENYVAKSPYVRGDRLYQCAGWCSRLDLAMKLVGTLTAKGSPCLILNAVEVPKPKAVKK